MVNKPLSIKKIIFSQYSAQQLLNICVCEINNTKKTIEYGTVYDPRMGTTESSHKCQTCNENAVVCPGHFGYIKLNTPILHPLYYKRILLFLQCFCFNPLVINLISFTTISPISLNTSSKAPALCGEKITFRSFLIGSLFLTGSNG